MGTSGHVKPCKEESTMGNQKVAAFIPAPSSLVLGYRAGDRMFMLGNNKRFQTLPKPGAFSLEAAAGASLCAESLLRLTWCLCSFCLQLAKNNNL